MAVITSFAENPTGYLTCEGIDLLSACWGIYEDLTPMLYPAELRGGMVLVPGQPGRVPQPQQIDDARWKYRFPIAGDVNPDGDPFADPVVGLISNLNELAPIFLPVDVLDNPLGTREVTYTVPGVGEFVADAQLSLDLSGVLVIGSDMQYGNRGALKRAELTIALPGGLFEAAGS